MSLEYDRRLKEYKDEVKNISDEDDKVKFKKVLKNIDKPWVLDYHHKPNSSAMSWMHGWQNKDSYKTEKRALQALEHLKKVDAYNNDYDCFRIYDIRNGKLDNE